MGLGDGIGSNERYGMSVLFEKIGATWVHPITAVPEEEEWSICSTAINADAS
jgi:hypothetical protein